VSEDQGDGGEHPRALIPAAITTPARVAAPSPQTRLGIAEVAPTGAARKSASTIDAGLGTTRTVAGPNQQPASQARPSSALEPSPGLRVRQYEVIREIGRGGMGRVVLARDTRLGRRVAMKFMTSGSRELTDRFLAEARTTALVSHDNIVVIHEVDEHEGTPYMVLEYLEGTTLRAQLEGKRIPAAHAIELIVPVVRALVRAHEAGIIHRDLKPENVFVTSAGSVKVLDFGIAKLLTDNVPLNPQQRARRPSGLERLSDLRLTAAGALLGTLPYMSPEQLGTDEIDHRSDLWAVGIMLYEMVVGRHPLALISATQVIAEIAQLDQPMPSVRAGAPDLPERLERIIDRCLVKRKAGRYATARELLDELEPLLPGRYGRALAEDESPFPGLSAFQESDADRFFGRSQDVARMVTRLREQPLVGIVGPSGVGKSSFVRAGVVPALKGAGESWEVHISRPGRQPLASLASLLAPLTTSGASLDGAQDPARDHDAMVARLAREPGYLGTLLRARAARKNAKLLLFIDQFEELYTLVADPEERRAYTRCLSAVADDAAAPLRVVVSMRSDFLDRAGEDPRFLDELTRGLVFLQPLGPAALRVALTQPIEMRGYRFEHPQMVDQMITALATTPGALPLLQFAAARLWDRRDRATKLLTHASYEAMGGIAGTLATHADQVLAGLAHTGQKLVRAVFQRLVTPERTRAIVDVRELRELSTTGNEIDQIVDHLVAARLLVVQSQGDSIGGSVEIVHESLIAGWPTLRRWLDEGQGDAAQLAQLRAAAGQWDQRGRPQGLLWRGEALVEARHWHARYRGELPARERAFLAAVFALGTRAARVKRTIIVGVIGVLSLAVAGGAIALVSIRDAEQTARSQAALAEREKHRAEQQMSHALSESERARQAERTAQERLELVRTEEAAKHLAQQDAREKGAQVEMTRDQLKVALAKAQRDRAVALDESRKAREATAREKQAKDEARLLYAKAKKHAEELERQRSKITTELRK